MNTSEFVAAQAAELAAAAAMAGSSLFEIGIKRFCTERILAEYGPGDSVEIDDLMLLAEDLETPLPDKRILELILETGVFESEGEESLRIRATVSLDRFYPSFFRARRLNIPLEDFRHALLRGDGGASVVDGGGTLVQPAACIEAVTRSWGFAGEIVGCVIDRGLGGVPVFWRCEGGPHVPLMPNPGTATTMDTALLFSTAIEFGLVPNLEQADREALGHFVSKVLLELQRKDPGWDQGAFVYDGPDEDFVGAFDSKYASRGSPPTVDGTSDALLALSLLSRWPESSGFLPRTIPIAAASAVNFLLRQQLEEGAWALYRYEADEHEMPARMFSSSLAASGLASALRASLMKGSLGETVHVALDRFASWLKRTAETEEEEEISWSPISASDLGSQQLFTTLWAARSLWSLLRISDASFTAPLDRLLDGALSFIINRWEPDPEAFAPVPVRVPTWAGPAVGQFKWELPADPLIGSLLLRVATMRGETIEPDLWSRITGVVASSLRDEEHGHWVDFLMKQEGQNRAVPGNTRYNQELLLSFLAYLKCQLNAIGVP